jgi:hypothetical protein
MANLLKVTLMARELPGLIQVKSFDRAARIVVHSDRGRYAGRLLSLR